MSDDRRIESSCSGRREINPEHCKLQHQFVDRLLQELEKRIDQRFESMGDALIIKTSEMDRRLEGLNELRGDVVKDRQQFLKVDIYNIEHRALQVAVDSIRLWKAELEGRASKASIISVIALAISSIATVINLYQSFSR